MILDKIGAVLAEIDGLIRELREAGKQEKEDRVPPDQRRLTGDVLLFLVRARALLKEKEGGRKHVHEG